MFIAFLSLYALQMITLLGNTYRSHSESPTLILGFDRDHSSKRFTANTNAATLKSTSNTMIPSLPLTQGIT